MFIYREAYYLERLEPGEGDPRHAEWKDQMAAKFNVAEIIISKQRHGPIGKVEVGFNPARVRFSDLDHTLGDNRRQAAAAGMAAAVGVGSERQTAILPDARKGFLPDGEE